VFKKLWPIPRPVILALACTLTANAFVAMAVLLPPVLAPLAAPEIGYAESETGLFVAIVSIAGTVSAILSGTLLRQIGPVRLLQLSLLYCAAGLGLLALAQLWLVVVAALVLGLGYGAITPACSQILVQVSPSAYRSLIFSINQTGVPLGGVLAGILLPPLSVPHGWRIATVLIALVGILIAIGLSVLRRRDLAVAAAERREALAGIRLVVSVPLLRRMILPSISFAIIQLCLGTFLVSFLTLKVGFDLAVAGAVLASAQGAGIVGRLLWGWMADRLLNSWKVLPLVGIIMSAATFVVASFLPIWPHFLVFLVAVVQGATAIGWNGVYLAEVARLAPAGQAGAVTGGALSLTIFGSMLGPPFFTFIVELSGSYALAFNLIAAFAFFSAVSGLWAGTGQRSDAP
jgi:MFS family permease